jgi:hypothetical protein
LGYGMNGGVKKFRFSAMHAYLIMAGLSVEFNNILW